MDFDDTPVRTDSYKEISESLMTDPGPITQSDNPFLNPFEEMKTEFNPYLNEIITPDNTTPSATFQVQQPY